jgi:hypothetical protein
MLRRERTHHIQRRGRVCRYKRDQRIVEQFILYVVERWSAEL